MAFTSVAPIYEQRSYFFCTGIATAKIQSFLVPQAIRKYNGEKSLREAMGLRIAICDDDWHMQQTLRLFIDQTYQDLDVLMDGYTSGEALLAAVQKQSCAYELILLDIEMRGLDGIETARRVRVLRPDCYIVFITSHDEFALTGYEVAAFRYLLKPLQPEKLTEAISAVRAELANQYTLHLEDGTEEALVRAKDVYYIEAQDKRVRVVTREAVLSDRHSLDEMAAMLKDEDFYRIHRSYLINMRYVVRLDGTNVQLANGDVVPISRLRKKAFKNVFQAYVKRTAR